MGKTEATSKACRIFTEGHGSKACVADVPSSHIYMFLSNAYVIALQGMSMSLRGQIMPAADQVNIMTAACKLPASADNLDQNYIMYSLVAPFREDVLGISNLLGNGSPLRTRQHRCADRHVHRDSPNAMGCQ